MSAEENKALVRRYYEALNRRDLAGVGALCTPDHVQHFPGLPEPIRGPQGVQDFSAQMLAAFPDCRFTLEQLIAEGDIVANHFTFEGTQTGAFMGMPPTGRSVRITANDVYRMEGGRIAEEWASPDLLGIMQQLGALPAPAAA